MCIGVETGNEAGIHGKRCDFIGDLRNLINGNGNEGGFWIRHRSEAVADRHGTDVKHDECKYYKTRNRPLSNTRNRLLSGCPPRGLRTVHLAGIVSCIDVMPKSLMIIIASLLFICGCQNGRERIATLKKDIRTQLPAGTSKTDVVAFLDKRKIPHEWLRISQRGPGDSWIYPDTHTEICLIHDAYGEGWLWNSVTVSVEIRFKFDASDSKLVSYSIQQIYKGL